MDGVSAIFAVVSLSVQLITTVKDARDLLRGIYDAPEELIRLVDLLDQLHQSLENVDAIFGQEQPAVIMGALRTCKKSVDKLDTLVIRLFKSTQGRQRARMAWATVKTALKKGELQDIRSQLHEHMTSLHLAVSLHSHQLQRLTLLRLSESAPRISQLTATNRLAIGKIEESGRQLSISSDSHMVSVRGSQSAKPAFIRQQGLVNSKMSLSIAYRGIFGNVRVQTTVKSLHDSRDMHSGQNRTVFVIKRLIIVPSFLSHAFEICFDSGFGLIPKTLNVRQVLPSESPIFGLCCNGDIKGLQVALSEGIVSPFAVDEYGMTLLIYGSLFCKAEMCRFLVQLGVDPNQADINGRKALQFPVAVPSIRPTDAAETCRILAQAQQDLTTEDAIKSFQSYSELSEVAEVLLSHYMLSDAYIDHGTLRFAALGTALCHYGSGEYGWAQIISKLLRHGVDAHGWKQRYGHSGQSNKITREPQLWTLLDTLFSYTATPIDSDIVATGWLSMLSETGYDVAAYVEKEVALRETQQGLMFTYSQKIYPVPRRLVLHAMNPPVISWDWVIDLDSPAGLVRHEFRNCNIMTDVSLYDWEENTWPFRFPNQALIGGLRDWEQCFESAERYDLKVQCRFDRRQKQKDARLRRRGKQGLKVPGAWIN